MFVFALVMDMHKTMIAYSDDFTQLYAVMNISRLFEIERSRSYSKTISADRTAENFNCVTQLQQEIQFQFYMHAIILLVHINQ
jgi:hypothetical protein